MIVRTLGIIKKNYHFIFYAICLFISFCYSCSNRTTKEVPLYKIVNGDSVCITNDSVGYTSICKIKNGIKNGVCEVRKQNNLVAEGLVVDNKKSGIWKYYNDSGRMSSVKQYYNDSLLYNLDVNNFIFSKQIVCNGSIGFIMPKEWVISPNLTNKNLIFIASGKKDDDGFAPSLSITIDTIGNKSFDQYVNDNAGLLPQKLENYYEVYQEATNYNQIEGRRVAYAFQVNGFKLGAILYFLKFNSGKVLIVNALSSNVDSHFLKYKGLFEEITASFERLKE